MTSPSPDSDESGDRREAMADPYRAGSVDDGSVIVETGDFARREFIGALICIAISVLAGVACVAWAAWKHGEAGAFAAGLGAGAVVLGTAIYAVVPYFFDRSLRTLVRAVGGLLFRAGLPLGVLLWARTQRPDLMEQGLFVAVVATYLAGWIFEAIWRVGLRNAAIRRETDRLRDRDRDSKTLSSVL